MTQEAEKREKRLWVDLKLLRSQQELTFGILDTRIDVMVERCTQTIMDRLNDLLETGADLGIEEHTRVRLAESRERTSTSFQT